MIDNIVLVITGTLHGRNVDELLQRCHPLGMFDTLGTLGAATNGEELYHFVLRDTPLGTSPLIWAYSCIAWVRSSMRRMFSPDAHFPTRCVYTEINTA